MQALCARLAFLTPKATLSSHLAFTVQRQLAVVTSRTHRVLTSYQAQSPTNQLRRCSALNAHPSPQFLCRANQAVKITQAAQDTYCKPMPSLRTFEMALAPNARFTATARFECVGVGIRARTDKVRIQPSSLCTLVHQPHVQSPLSTGRPRPPFLRPYSVTQALVPRRRRGACRPVRYVSAIPHKLRKYTPLPVLHKIQSSPYQKPSRTKSRIIKIKSSNLDASGARVNGRAPSRPCTRAGRVRSFAGRFR
ncbi:hypothetical protein K438DRAFT_1848646 [Mycena galopus ATCC 62051]|nr:hypothetical protein K438DRAFT_1848646 [Mycena galopus ATCC 62051]